MLIACYIVDYSYIKTYFCIPCTERWLALVKENVPVDFADNDSILFYNIVYILSEPVQISQIREVAVHDNIRGE